MSLHRYEPMLATAGVPDADATGWRYELKWDGIRALLYWDGSRVELVSRRGNEITGSYPELGGFAARRPCIVDGEVVAFDDEGLPSFERLQQRMNVRDPAGVRVAAAEVPIAYVAFDLLLWDVPIISRPLEERRGQLTLLDPAPPFTTSDLYEDGAALRTFVAERNLEGVVAKRLGSCYQPGMRSPDWRKIPHYRTLRAVVGGFTPGEGGRTSTFGSLAVGLHTSEGLRWIGTVGSGFSDRQLAEIRAALDQMRVPTSPFLPHPELPGSWSWVEPQLVALVQYKEMTRVGRLRAPVFLGFSGEAPETATWDGQVAVRG